MTTTITRQAPTLRRRAKLAPERVNVEARTFEAVCSTGSKGRRADWFGPDYHESLLVSETAVDLARLKDGAALLNNHNAFGDALENQLGVVEDAWIQGSEVWCRCRVARTAKGDELLQRIQDGEIRHLSMGYQVSAWTKHVAEGELDHLEATRWEPHEVSIVNVPFDAGANVRSAEGQSATHPCVIVTVRGAGPKANPMAKTKTAAPAAKKRASVVPSEDETRMTDETEEETRAVEGAEDAEGEERAAETEEAPAEDEESEGARSLDASATRAVQAERQRVGAIRSFARGLHLGEAAVERLVNTNRTLAQLTESGAILQEYADVAPKTNIRSTVQVTEEEPTKRLRAIEDALLLRMRPQAEMPSARAEAANDFRALTLREIGRDMLEMRGQRTRGMSTTQLARRSLHTTSDMPKLLANVSGKVLKAEYAEEPQTFAPLVTRQDVPDFKPATLVAIAGGGALAKKNEKGEYKSSTLTEVSETYQVARYGEIVGFTDEMMINDDLAGLGRIVRIQARRVRMTESKVFWDIFAVPGALTGDGPLLADGSGIFATARLNKLTRILSKTGLGEARALMRKQKDIGGDPLNVAAKFLLVPPSLETKADELTALISPTEAGKVNPFSGKFQVIVETRLEAVGAAYWWMAAAPSALEGVIMGGLEGESGPQFDTEESFDTDGVRFKVRLDVYAKAVDFRPFTRSTGAVAE